MNNLKRNNMTPKEKADELVLKFKKYAYYPKTNDDEVFINQLNNNAKQCALIAVDEIINGYEFDILYIEHKRIMDNINFWDEVKQEIEKL
jgi:hypothetical protein